MSNEEIINIVKTHAHKNALFVILINTNIEKNKP